MLYSLLLEGILTLSVVKEYTAYLRVVPFPTDWPRVQGPLYYLKSYSLLEYARQSLVAPVLLRTQLLQKKYIRKALLLTLTSIPDPVSYIYSQYTAAARSNLVLISILVSLADRANIGTIVYSYRTNLQQLLFALSQSIRRDKRCSRLRSAVLTASTRVSRELSIEILVLLTEGGPTISASVSKANKKAEQYLSDIKKPNIYIAVYYPATSEEYSLPINVNILISKDKYREFKKQIYSTNHRHLEKDLLTKENLRQTLRFLLADSIDNTIATYLVKDLYS